MADIDAQRKAFRYKAFISYSRRDRSFAVRLQRELESYVLPRAIELTGRAKPRSRPFKPVFRDESELLTARHLPDRISEALADSEFLIVVCSPDAVRSPWVEREILDFTGLRGPDQILAVVARGEPNAAQRHLPEALEALPRALRFKIDRDGNLTEKAVEPLWIDRRNRGGDGRHMFLRIVGTLLGLKSLDELILRDRQAERRRHRVTQSIAAGVLVLAALSIFMLLVGEQTRNAALIAQSQFLARDADAATSAGNARLGMLLALRALPENIARPDRPFVPEAEVALRNAVLSLHELRTIQTTVAPTVSALSFSPDGKRIAAAVDNGSLMLFDVNDRSPAINFKTGAQGIRSLEFSQDGKRIAIACDDKAVRVLDAATGRTIAKWQSDEVVLQVRYFPDGNRIAILGLNDIYLWDPQDGNAEKIASQKNSYEQFDISPDGKSIAVASGVGHGGEIWDVASRSRIRTFDQKNGTTTSVRYLSNEAMFLNKPSGFGLWSTGDGTQLVNYATTNFVFDAVASGNGHNVVTLEQPNLDDPDAMIHVWEAISGTLLATMRTSDRDLRMIAVSPDGTMLATVGSDRSLRIWSIPGVRASRVTAAIAMSHDGSRALRLIGTDHLSIRDVASGDRLVWLDVPARSMPIGGFFLRDDRKVAVTLLDGPVLMFDAQTGVSVGSGPTLSLSTGLSFSTDGKRGAAVASLLGNKALLWDTADGHVIADLAHDDGLVCGTLFSPDGKYVVTTGTNPPARLWNAGDGWPIQDFWGHAKGVCHSSFSRNERHLLTASGDGTARIWDISSGKTLVTLRGHGDAVNSAIYSPDESRILTTSRDHTMRIWNSRTGAQIAVMSLGRLDIRTIAFSPDGRRIAAGAMNGTVQVWNAETAAQVMSVRQSGAIDMVGFSKDGRSVISHSTSGYFQTWQIVRGCQLLIGEAADYVRNGHLVLSPDELRREFVGNGAGGALTDLYATVHGLLWWLFPAAGGSCRE
jgi:WD40 repeat protein